MTIDERTVQREKVHDKEYTTLYNYVLQDSRLSWKARGLLVYLLSLPEDWRIYVSELATRAPDGEGSTRTAFKQLIEYGYISSTTERDDKKRITGIRYVVHEKPKPQKDQDAKKLDGENQDVGNRPLQSTHIQSTHDTNTTATPVERPSNSPTNCEQWIAHVKKSTNKNAALRQMFASLYPDNELPSFGYIGKMAAHRDIGGPVRLAQLLWQANSYRVTGDPLRYCIGLARGVSKRQPDSGGDVIERRDGKVVAKVKV